MSKTPFLSLIISSSKTMTLLNEALARLRNSPRYDNQMTKQVYKQENECEFQDPFYPQF